MTARDTFVFEIGPGYALLRGDPSRPELDYISN